MAGAGGVAGIGGEIFIDLAEADRLEFVARAELKIEGRVHLERFHGEQGVALGNARWGDDLGADGGEVAAGDLIADGAGEVAGFLLDEFEATLVGLVFERGVDVAGIEVDLGVGVVGDADAEFGGFEKREGPGEFAPEIEAALLKIDGDGLADGDAVERVVGADGRPEGAGGAEGRGAEEALLVERALLGKVPRSDGCSGSA